jgi:uncharacterized protein (DUF1330 family)
MPEVFVIAQMTIHDQALFARYSGLAAETVLQYGGDFVIGGRGPREMLEGVVEIPFVAVARFPSYEIALRWYRSPEYAPLIGMRQSAAVGSLMLIEGLL